MTRRFKYEVLLHEAEKFKQLVYFCSPSGECTGDMVPADQFQVLGGILDERGQEGWELVQLVFGENGIMSIWKREVEE